ncbi:MAG: hypothetical protein COB92_03990 [Robiginitomaculum sp.]|nr:MAG: hypothetical protein COB92_03990 [Robiginitomaculum sp.]
MTMFFDKIESNNKRKKLHTETYGNGDDPIVFLAGLGGTTRYWLPGIKSLGKNHSVTLIDLLGFGESPKPWVRYNVERHVSALNDVLPKTGPITLVGHSLGALLAVAYAARYPSQIKKLILISLPYFGSKDKAVEYFKERNVRGGFLYTNAILTIATCILTRRVFGKILPFIIRDLPRDIVKDLVKHTWCSSTSSLWEVVYRHDASVDFRSLPKQLEVLFIHGEDDLSAPISAVRSIAASRPNWNLFSLDGVDHHPFIRETEKCLALIDASQSNSLA